MNMLTALQLDFLQINFTVVWLILAVELIVYGIFIFI